MAPAATRVSAALLAALLGPAAAIQSASDERTLLTGFDLGEFMSGFMHGASGEDTGIETCTKIGLDLKGVKDSVTKLQSATSMFAGMKDMFAALGVVGKEFQGCKSGIASTVHTAKAMFENRPGDFGAKVSAFAQPVMHFPEIMKLAGSAAKALKEQSFRDAGESMGQILSVAGLVSTPSEMDPGAPPASWPMAGPSSPMAAWPMNKGPFGFFKPPMPGQGASNPMATPSGPTPSNPMGAPMPKEGPASNLQKGKGMFGFFR